MLYFPCLNVTARSYDEAELLWARSQEAYPSGSVDGQRWLVSLYRKSRDEAQDDYSFRLYDEQIRRAEHLLCVMAAPVMMRSPVGV